MDRAEKRRLNRVRTSVEKVTLTPPLAKQWRAQISEIDGSGSGEAFLNHPGEIYRHCPYPGSYPVR